MIKEVNSFLNEACDDYRLTSMKIDAVVEAAYRELQINYSSAELKVMTESGTDDDLAYLYEEADNGLMETVIKAIEKIKDALLKFFSDVKDKIITIFSNKENEEKIDKLEKKIKLFPILGKKKVLVENYEEEEKCAKKHLSMLAKLKAKLKSGQDVSSEDVANVEKSFMEEHEKLIGISSAIAVTAIAAIALYKSRKKKVTDGTKADEAESNKFFDGLKELKDSTAQKLASAWSSITQVNLKDRVRSLTNPITEVKKIIKGNVKVDNSKVLDALKESAEDEETPAIDNEIDTDEIPQVDEEPDIDPWDDVMRDLSNIGSDDDNDVDGEKCSSECGNNCAVEDTDTSDEGKDDGTDDGTDAIEEVQESVFNALIKDIESLV